MKANLECKQWVLCCGKQEIQCHLVMQESRHLLCSYFLVDKLLLMPKLLDCLLFVSLHSNVT